MKRHGMFGLAAFATAGALLVAGCGSSGTAPTSGQQESTPEEVELVLTTWGEFGYSEEVLAQFTAEHPGVTVTHRKASSSGEARDATTTYLAAGSGLGDVIAIESAWLPEMMEYADKWVPVPENLADRWGGWKSAPATGTDGVMRMYGVDGAPVGICFNRDLFAQAGLPTDRAGVATLLTGDWDHSYSVGEQFSAATGVPWTNSATAIGEAQFRGLEYASQMPDGKVIATTDPTVRKVYDTTVAHIDIMARMRNGSDDWNKGLGQNAFARQLCPSWMLGVIKAAAPDSTSWDLADVFPGNSINWGGSYLAVPTQTKHPELATALADYLTSPETQLVTFENVGAFPSQVEALASPKLLGIVDPFFQDVPMGEIFAARANAITARPFNGPLSLQILSSFNDAVARVEAGTASADESWATFVSDVESLTR